MESTSKIEERHTAPVTDSSASIFTAAFVLSVYLVLVATVYIFNRDGYSGIKTSPFVDALYVSVITLCRIGYGDITPLTPVIKTLSCIFVLVGLGIFRVVITRVVRQLRDLQKRAMLGQMRIYLKVFGVMVFCIGTGAVALHYLEESDWEDSLYVSVISVTTTGYGNPGFRTLYGRLFASFWLLVSTVAIASACLFLAEERMGKRHQKKFNAKD